MRQGIRSMLLKGRLICLEIKRVLRAVFWPYLLSTHNYVGMKVMGELMLHVITKPLSTIG